MVHGVGQFKRLYKHSGICGVMVTAAGKWSVYTGLEPHFAEIPFVQFV